MKEQRKLHIRDFMTCLNFYKNINISYNKMSLRRVMYDLKTIQNELIYQFREKCNIGQACVINKKS